MVRRIVTVALRTVIGAVFIYASLDKIIHPDRFAEIVSDYQILPDPLVNPFSVTLPWVELVTGLFLVSGRWLASAASLAVGMTVTFMVAVGYAMVHGGEAYHCGCFTTSQEGGPSPPDVLWRDAVLLLGAVSLLVVSWRVEGIADGRGELSRSAGDVLESEAQETDA